MNHIARQFEDLDFFDSDIVSVGLDPPARLVVTLRNVVVDRDPAGPRTLARCQLVFEGTTSSVRRIREYASNPAKDDFLPPRVIQDLDPLPPSANSRTFVLEGRLHDPDAWIEEWTVTATECRVIAG